jgi:acyl-CoA synthetase (AMP-forming)/AMP-acid ligase II
MNLAQFLTQTARRLPDEVGFVWGEKRWTWREMEARVDAMAAALQNEFGVEKGERILIQSANSNQMFESMFACFRIGAVWVPANYRQSPTTSPIRRRRAARSA